MCDPNKIQNSGLDCHQAPNEFTKHTTHPLSLLYKCFTVFLTLMQPTGASVSVLIVMIMSCS